MITGASAGIGKASSLLFAQEGAKVVAVDLDEKKGQVLFDNCFCVLLLLLPLLPPARKCQNTFIMSELRIVLFCLVRALTEASRLWLCVCVCCASFVRVVMAVGCC